jgi:hypothetical protein
MSAFVLVLAAGVVSSGPEVVSGEVEQRLDLRGKWEGTWVTPSDVAPYKVIIEKNQFRWFYPDGDGGCVYWDASDEGTGRLRITWHHASGLGGIYRQDGDRLLICFRIGEGRPTDFRFGRNPDQCVLTLRRIKPGK